ncbi:MAG: alginate lyase family protein [Acidobacteriaceae bacterium]|nr:alginate lyase family protein [Acidobacteriaceae bacterium]
MRTAGEIIFRARQESSNLLLLTSPPDFSGDTPLELALPDPHGVADALRGSQYASVIESTARDLLAHHIPLLGATIDTGPKIHWRRDYVHAIESGSAYFRSIPYLSFASVGDHKFVWELNRHQHLVLLAQAFLLTGSKDFTQEIFTQLDSWLEQNPFQRGINWASALEVAFRALSWIWVYHLTASEMGDRFRRRFLSELYRHGRYLAVNLSVYFSPNTHLLGEAVALFALGTLFPEFHESNAWRESGAQIVEAQLVSQVRKDGSHFEQSTYYHVYALDFFLFFYVLAGRPEKFRAPLVGMAEYLHWLLGPSRRIAFIGDDDGGRVFHPYGQRDQFGRATLATCGILLGRGEWAGTLEDIAEQAAWWIGADALQLARQERSSPFGARLFQQSGAAFLESGALSVQMNCGGFGAGSAGHSHSDTLSVIASLRGERIFGDPGTYTYADPDERNWFRGSAAHNTVRIDELDQAETAGPFRWASKPQVALTAWKPQPDGGFVDAICRYGQFTHRRRVLLKPEQLLVLDEISGPAGEHTCEQIWQLGPGASKVKMSFSAPASRCASKWSPAYGAKCPGTALVATVTGCLPVGIAMFLTTGGDREITIAEARKILEPYG